MSIIQWLSDLFRDDRYYSSSKIPSDLPVEMWMIYADESLGTAVRILISTIPWSEVSPETKGYIKIDSVCSASNPYVLCIVDSFGKKDHLVTMSKTEFLSRFEMIKEVDFHGLAVWMDQLLKRHEKLQQIYHDQSQSIQEILSMLKDL